MPLHDDSRRQQRIAHVREDILVAASRAFGRAGLEAATLQDIAREAGYTVQSLYSYFEGKQAIADALIDRMADDLAATFTVPAPASAPLPEKLEQLFRRWLDFGARWRGALAIIFALRATRSAAPRTGTRLDGDVFVQHLTAWLEHCARREELGGNDPAIVAQMLRGLLGGLFLTWRDAPQRASKEGVELALRLFLGGVGGLVTPRRRRGAGRDKAVRARGRR
jgi:AcrR family transcriptional regulator